MLLAWDRMPWRSISAWLDMWPCYPRRDRITVSDPGIRTRLHHHCLCLSVSDLRWLAMSMSREGKVSMTSASPLHCIQRSRCCNWRICMSLGPSRATSREPVWTLTRWHLVQRIRTLASLSIQSWMVVLGMEEQNQNIGHDATWKYISIPIPEMINKLWAIGSFFISIVYSFVPWVWPHGIFFVKNANKCVIWCWW